MFELTDDLLIELGWKVAWSYKPFERELFDLEDVAQQARLGMIARGPFEERHHAIAAGKGAVISMYRKAYGRNNHKWLRAVPGGTPFQDYYLFDKYGEGDESRKIELEHAAWILRHLDEKTLEILDRWLDGQEKQQITEEMGIPDSQYWVMKTNLPLEVASIETWARLRRRSLEQLRSMRKSWNTKDLPPKPGLGSSQLILLPNYLTQQFPS